MQPTDPEPDIQTTGKCEVWIGEVNLMAQVKLARKEAYRTDPESPTSPANHATLPRSSLRIYNGLVYYTNTTSWPLKE